MIALTLGTALLATPTAFTATSAIAASLVPMKTDPMNATYVCRAPVPNEKTNAAFGSAALVCKSMAPLMHAGSIMVPSNAGMDGSAADNAWQSWLAQSLSVPLSGDG
ncbi:MAG TPA: hypothetical protein VGN14_05300 [Candidatus Elarobacter sp.]